MIDLLFIKPLILFIFNSPQEWLLVAAAGLLLFGAKRLPDLAKSIGKARKEFKKGIIEAENESEDEARRKANGASAQPPAIAQLDDQTILEEIRRRREIAERSKQLS